VHHEFWGPMRMQGSRRAVIALAVLACTAALAWSTMEADRIRTVVLVVLAVFAARIVLAARRAE
jgi:hypothetical protein